MLFLYFFVFIASCAALFWAGNFLVGAITKIAKCLGWKEFVVAFFILAFATSIPNFFVGIISAMNNVPELSFGDIVGANIIDISLVVGLAALISRSGLSAPSRTVQTSSLFTIGVAILPVILIQDGILSRADGILLLFVFVIYLFWLFNKKERFQKVYDGNCQPFSLKDFSKNISIFLAAAVVLIFAANGIVKSAMFFADVLNLPIGLIGILIIALGTCLPEASFTLSAARKGHDWMILGNLMGSVVITTTLVLGTVAILHPIQVANFSPFAIARIFLILAAVFFFFAVKTDRKITKTEAFVLILIYPTFVAIELLAK